MAVVRFNRSYGTRAIGFHSESQDLCPGLRSNRAYGTTKSRRCCHAPRAASHKIAQQKAGLENASNPALVIQLIVAAGLLDRLVGFTRCLGDRTQAPHDHPVVTG